MLRVRRACVIDIVLHISKQHFDLGKSNIGLGKKTMVSFRPCFLSLLKYVVRSDV
jgi:hypothetical protein